MRTAAQFSMVWVTTPDRKTARRLAQAALSARLVACANLVPGVESHYWWQGKLTRSQEVLIIFKTSRTSVKALEALVLELHPYDTPEVIEMGLSRGTPRYLDWILDSVSRRARSRS
jgi:periplasmic divalent cation tolerance protein